MAAGAEDDTGDPFELAGENFARFYPQGSRVEAEFHFSRRLITAARLWQNLIDGTLKAATGQNRARWQTLFAIAFADPPVTTLKMAERLKLRWPTMVRTLANLEGEGFITRSDNPDDGRSRLIEITGEGRDMLDRTQGILDPQRHQVMADISDEDLATATRVLATIMARIEAGG